MAVCYKRFLNHVMIIHYLHLFFCCRIRVKLYVIFLLCSLYTDKTNFAFLFSTYKTWYDSTKRVCGVVLSTDICWLCTALSSSCPWANQCLSWFIHQFICIDDEPRLFCLSPCQKYTVCHLVVPSFPSVCLRDTVHYQHIVEGFIMLLLFTDLTVTHLSKCQVVTRDGGNTHAHARTAGGGGDPKYPSDWRILFCLSNRSSWWKTTQIK